MSSEITDFRYEFSEEFLAGRQEELADDVRQWLKEHFGDRCAERADNCPCCQKWAAFDALFGKEK